MIFKNDWRLLIRLRLHGAINVVTSPEIDKKLSKNSERTVQTKLWLFWTSLYVNCK